MGKIPWRRKCNPLQCSCLIPWAEDPGKDTVHEVAKGWTWLGNWTTADSTAPTTTRQRHRILAPTQGHLWLSDLRVIFCHHFYSSSMPLSFWFFQKFQNFILSLMYEILLVWNSQCGFCFLTGVWLIQKAKVLMSSIFKGNKHKIYVQTENEQRNEHISKIN